MKKLFITLLFFLFCSTVQAAEETIRIYPTDFGRNTLNESDRISSWSEARHYDGDLVTDPYTDLDHLDQKSHRVGSFYRIYRSSMRFDTSVIPGASEIKSAKLKVFKELSNNAGDTSLVFTQHLRSSSTVVTEKDFSITNFGEEISRGLLIDGEYTDYTFNDLGLNYISKNDFTVIGALTEYDYDNIDPGYIFRAASFYTTSAPDVNTHPYLEITYIVPDEEGEKDIETLSAELETIIEDSINQKSIKNSYLANVKKIKDFFNEVNPKAALNQVLALLKKTEGDGEKGKIEPETKEEINEVGQEVLNLIEGEQDVVEEIPLMTQISSSYSPGSEVWSESIYADGRADYPGSCGSTIRECGCALSSFAMLGQAYGLTHGVDGSEANPENINSWLLENGGYDIKGNIFWNQAVKYFGRKGKDNSSYFEIDSLKEKNIGEVELYLEENKPVITETLATNRNGLQFTHFLLTKDISGDSYGLLDPLWYNTEILDDIRDRTSWVQDYNNYIASGRLFNFNDSPKMVSRSIEVHLSSPAELLLSDRNGNKLGYDPRTDEEYNEIEGEYYEENAFYSEELAESGHEPHVTKVIYLKDPVSTDFNLEVVGTGQGDYNVSVNSIGEGGKSKLQEFSGTTTTGRVDNYIISVPDDGAGRCNVGANRLREIAARYESNSALNTHLLDLADILETKCSIRYRDELPSWISGN